MKNPLLLLRTRLANCLPGVGAALVSLAIAAPGAVAAEAPAWGPIELGGQVVMPGETARTFVNISRAMGGESRMLDAPLVVVRGSRPGPTLCLTAGIHGDELNGIEIARRIYAGVPAGDLSGTLIAAPAVNMPGVRSGSRYLPDRRDLNRAFPGNPKGSLASRIAYTVTQEVIRFCDALIDLHTGSANRTNIPQIRTDLDSPEALALARSFGVGVVLHGRGPNGSLRREALDAGVPAVIYEAGEPLRFQEPKIAEGVKGVRNVMVDLGMIPGEAKRRPSEVYRKTSWIRAGDATGVFFPSVEPGDAVHKGDVIGTVTDPQTDRVMEITAPRDGRIIGMAVPQFVLPGYGLFNLGFEAE